MPAYPNRPCPTKTSHSVYGRALLISNCLNIDMKKTKGKLADMLAILADIEQAKGACEIYLSGKFDDNMRVKRALYESALISYRRALANGSTRLPFFGKKMWKFTKEQKLKINRGYKKEVEEIFDVANKCVAHRANKEARVISFPKEEGTGEFTIMAKYKERVDLIRALQVITERYWNLLLHELIPTEQCKLG